MNEAHEVTFEIVGLEWELSRQHDGTWWAHIEHGDDTGDGVQLGEQFSTWLEAAFQIDRSPFTVVPTWEFSL